MDKFKETHIDDIEKEISPLNKILDLVGWCVITKILLDAEKNEDYESCTEIRQLFIDSGKRKENFENKNEILKSDFSEEYEQISEKLMQEYVKCAKKFLGITKY